MRVLVVDDEEVIRDVLAHAADAAKATRSPPRDGRRAPSRFFETRARTTSSCSTSMLPTVRARGPARRSARATPTPIVVIVTAYSSIEGAIEAMREGAFHYIPKPFQNEEVPAHARARAPRRAA